MTVNARKEHTGMWTRVNRKNPNEKSVIDYIITSKALLDQIIESSTDEAGILLIQGKNPTDHNTITVTINTKTKNETKKSKRWKKGDEKQWKQYNEEITKEWALLKPRNRNTSKLQEIITKSMSTNIGTKTIYPNKKIKILNTDIVKAKKNQKSAKNRIQQCM
jgi:hypothetical protein